MKILNFCPFCGSEKLKIHKNPSKNGTVIWFKIIHPVISTCSVSMMDSNEKVLIEKWNQRRCKPLNSNKK